MAEWARMRRPEFPHIPTCAEGYRAVISDGQEAPRGIPWLSAGRSFASPGSLIPASMNPPTTPPLFPRPGRRPLTRPFGKFGKEGWVFWRLSAAVVLARMPPSRHGRS